MSNIIFTVLSNGFLYKKNTNAPKQINNILEYGDSSDTGSIFFFISASPEAGTKPFYFNSQDNIKIIIDGVETVISGTHGQIVQYVTDVLFIPNLASLELLNSPHLNTFRPPSPSNVTGAGISGYSGYSGVGGGGSSGYSGYSGFSGQSGYSGYSGKSGYSGYSGYSGAGGAGSSGYSGYSGSSSAAIERSATYASITNSTVNRLIFVHADETQDSNKTMYAYVNLESPPLQFLQIIL